MTTRPNLAPINTENTVFDFDLHPSQDLVISGLITGRLQCHRYGDAHELLWDNKPFKKSCRGVMFNPDGSKFYSISKDRSIVCMDTQTAKVVDLRENTHEQPLNALLCLNENLLATGDDQGLIKLWDTRKKDAIMTWKEHEDFIAQMVFNEDKNTLVVAGGDGYLSTWQLRKQEVSAMSDHMEDELLSVVLVKNNEKAVVGSQEGVLSIWDWGDWGDYRDRIIGHPESIGAIAKLDEDTICTGSSDGMIRLVSILPNGFHGILGDHGEDMPIEQIKLAHDKRYIVSSGHDESLRFWNVEHLYQEEEEKDEDAEQDASNDSPALDAVDSSSQSVQNDTPAVPTTNADDDWEDDSDDSDVADKKKRKKNKKQKNMPPPKKKNTKASTFFADL
ncbi:WD40 repeat-like protein [Hesseltinella vesiculosa]|uniref:WD repeat-containing protein JIP5 n=1 Tax=Hesseltinella vesiculosa TaxID=101127 RepID=A0A1X2GFC9_9FUNG|nr:WD40 repeat-like protein [Hesseltinella vesiculosa]